jgi:hypothetical protein
MSAIEAQRMAPFYKVVCKDLKWTEDLNLSAIEAKHMTPFYKVVCKDLKWTEDALLAKSEYLTKIGQKEEAIESIR